MRHEVAMFHWTVYLFIPHREQLLIFHPGIYVNWLVTVLHKWKHLHAVYKQVWLLHLSKSRHVIELQTGGKKVRNN
jgi:hypothetical protein